MSNNGDVLPFSRLKSTDPPIGKPSTPSSSSNFLSNLGVGVSSDDYRKQEKAFGNNNNSDSKAIGSGLSGDDANSKAMTTLHKVLDRQNERLMRLTIECTSRQSALNALRKDVHEVIEVLKRGMKEIYDRFEKLQSGDDLTIIEVVEPIKVTDIPQIEEKAIGSLSLIPKRRVQNPEELKIYSKVMAALPKEEVSNKIAGYINFFKHQLDVEPDWAYQLDGETGVWTVSSTVLGVVMGEGRDKRKKTAREYCAKDALRKLNDDPQLVYYFIEASGILDKKN